MKSGDRQISEIIAVPPRRSLKGTDLPPKGGRSNSYPSGNSQCNKERRHEPRSARACSCGNELRIHKTFAHTSGTSHDFLVDKDEIKNLMVGLLRSQLGSSRYEHKQCSQKCLQLCEIIEANVRKKCPDCKVVSSVLIGALRDKGPAIASQSLYSECRDCIALAYYRNQSLFASAAVFVLRL